MLDNSENLCPRQKREELEKLMLSPLASRAAQSRGRAEPESPCQLRTCYQRDVDRITHSKAFRRLKLKTQCFLRPEGDHYRTRMTHTLEVSRIARTISRALELNEDLTEAVALGHDLGHTPFGHAGERALNEILADQGGFRHYEQSLRVVDLLEKDGSGLNLCWEVRDGILRHTNDPLAATLEGQAVRLADRIAYINHDFDDAVRAGILTDNDIPFEVAAYFGSTYSARINSMIAEIVSYSRGKTVLSLSPQGKAVQDVYHEFMFDRVYRNPTAKAEESKVLGLLEGLYRYYLRNAGQLPEEYAAIAQRDGLQRAVGDFISCMTDRYAVSRYTQLFIPEGWSVL